MSKKYYNYKTGKYKGFNTTRGWLLSTEQIALVRYYLFLAGIQFKLEAKRNLRNGYSKSLTMHEWHKYKEVTSLCADLENLLPYVYVRV